MTIYAVISIMHTRYFEDKTNYFISVYWGNTTDMLSFTLPNCCVLLASLVTFSHWLYQSIWCLPGSPSLTQEPHHKSNPSELPLLNDLQQHVILHSSQCALQLCYESPHSTYSQWVIGIVGWVVPATGMRSGCQRGDVWCPYCPALSLRLHSLQQQLTRPTYRRRRTWLCARRLTRHSKTVQSFTHYAH